MKTRPINIDIAAQSLVAGLNLTKFKDFETIEQVCDCIESLPQSRSNVSFLMQSIIHQFKPQELLKALNERISSPKTLPYSLFERSNFLNFLEKELRMSSSDTQSSLPVYESFIAVLAANQKTKNLTVFDPTLGNGFLLFHTFLSPLESKFNNYADFAAEANFFIVKKLFGVEVSQQKAEVAKWLAKTFGFDCEISSADSFIAAVDQKTDLVICDPPFGLKLSPAQINREWQVQRPSQFASSWAWVQICLERIAPGGAGIVFLPLAALGTSKKEEILTRNKVFRKGLIEAVISIPPQPSNWHQIPTCALVLRSPHTQIDLNQARTLFIDIPKLSASNNTSRFSFISDDRTTEALNAYQRFRQNQVADLEGYSKSVSCSDASIVDNDGDLTPALYVTNLATGLDVNLNYGEEAKKLDKLTKRIDHHTKAVLARLVKTHELRANYVRLGQLVEEKKLVLIPGANTRKSRSGQGLTQALPGRGHTKDELPIQMEIDVLDAPDIRRPGPLSPIDTRSVALPANQLNRVTTQPGDIVLVRTGTPAAKVDYEGGHVVLSPLSIIRITDLGREQVTPEILVSVLTSDLAKRFMRGVTIGRLSIEKVPIPVFNSGSLLRIQDLLLPIKQLSEATNELNEQVLGIMKQLETTLSAGINSQSGSK